MSGVRTRVLQDLSHALPPKGLQLASSRLHTSQSTRRFWSFLEFSRKEPKDRQDPGKEIAKDLAKDITKDLLPAGPGICALQLPLRSKVDLCSIAQPSRIVERGSLRDQDQEDLLSFLDGNLVPRNLKWKLKGYRTLRHEDAGDFAFVPGGSALEFDILPRAGVVGWTEGYPKDKEQDGSRSLDGIDPDNGKRAIEALENPKDTNLESESFLKALETPKDTNLESENFLKALDTPKDTNLESEKILVPLETSKDTNLESEKILEPLETSKDTNLKSEKILEPLQTLKDAGLDKKSTMISNDRRKLFAPRAEESSNVKTRSLIPRLIPRNSSTLNAEGPKGPEVGRPPSKIAIPIAKPSVPSTRNARQETVTTDTTGKMAAKTLTSEVSNENSGPCLVKNLDLGSRTVTEMKTTEAEVAEKLVVQSRTRTKLSPEVKATEGTTTNLRPQVQKTEASAKEFGSAGQESATKPMLHTEQKTTETTLNPEGQATAEMKFGSGMRSTVTTTKLNPEGNSIGNPKLDLEVKRTEMEARPVPEVEAKKSVTGKEISSKLGGKIGKQVSMLEGNSSRLFEANYLEWSTMEREPNGFTKLINPSRRALRKSFNAKDQGHGIRSDAKSQGHTTGFNMRGQSRTTGFNTKGQVQTTGFNMKDQGHATGFNMKVQGRTAGFNTKGQGQTTGFNMKDRMKIGAERIRGGSTMRKSSNSILDQRISSIEKLARLRIRSKVNLTNPRPVESLTMAGSQQSHSSRSNGTIGGLGGMAANGGSGNNRNRKFTALWPAGETTKSYSLFKKPLSQGRSETRLASRRSCKDGGEDRCQRNRKPRKEQPKRNSCKRYCCPELHSGECKMNRVCPKKGEKYREPDDSPRDPTCLPPDETKQNGKEFCTDPNRRSANQCERNSRNSRNSRNREGSRNRECSRRDRGREDCKRNERRSCKRNEESQPREFCTNPRRSQDCQGGGGGGGCQRSSNKCGRRHYSQTTINRPVSIVDPDPSGPIGSRRAVHVTGGPRFGTKKDGGSSKSDDFCSGKEKADPGLSREEIRKRKEKELQEIRECKKGLSKKADASGAKAEGLAKQPTGLERVISPCKRARGSEGKGACRKFGYSTVSALARAVPGIVSTETTRSEEELEMIPAVLVVEEEDENQEDSGSSSSSSRNNNNWLAMFLGYGASWKTSARNLLSPLAR